MKCLKILDEQSDARFEVFMAVGTAGFFWISADTTVFIYRRGKRQRHLPTSGHGDKTQNS
jgi:hypothetical protein